MNKLLTIIVALPLVVLLVAISFLREPNSVMDWQ